MLSDEGEGSEDARMQKVCFCDFCDDDDDEEEEEDGAMVRISGCKKFIFSVNSEYDNGDE